MENKIKEMIKLQNILNIKTCGENWVAGTTTDGRKITWLRYIRQEIAEAIDSSDTYKHWKNLNGNVDWENLKIEVVDIWHFIISRSIELIGIDKSMKVSGTNMAEKSLYLLPTYIKKNTEPLDYLKTVECLEELTKVTFIRPYSASALVSNFALVMNSIHMDIDELYRLYIIKNVLNIFRQNNGYKDGSYKKVINGEEDNVHICKIFAENSDLTPDELYAKYNEYYNNCKGSSNAC